jgi:AcrR family transcriptional regulator
MQRLGDIEGVGEGKRRRVGRPRRLTLEAIIDAACEMQGDSLDMASLGRRLGVGVATLYGYLRGRDHLLRLVTERRNRIGQIDDHGQSWQDIVREHAAKSFQIWTSWPEMIHQVMEGGVHGVLSKDYLEALLVLLTQRGFTPSLALSLYYEISQIVMGAAVTASYLRACGGIGGHDKVMRSLAYSPSAQDLPTLRTAIEAGASAESIVGTYIGPLNRLIAEYEARLQRAGAEPQGRVTVARRR